MWRSAPATAGAQPTEEAIGCRHFLIERVRYCSGTGGRARKECPACYKTESGRKLFNQVLYVSRLGQSCLGSKAAWLSRAEHQNVQPPDTSRFIKTSQTASAATVETVARGLLRKTIATVPATSLTLPATQVCGASFISADCGWIADSCGAGDVDSISDEFPSQHGSHV